MVLPFPSFSAYFQHSCRNSCCLLLHFLITSVQSSLLLPCLHHYICFSFSHNSGLSSQVLPHSHNSVHYLSPLSVCKMSSKCCSLPFSFFELHVLPKVSSHLTLTWCFKWMLPIEPKPDLLVGISVLGRFEEFFERRSAFSSAFVRRRPSTQTWRCGTVVVWRVRNICIAM